MLHYVANIARNTYNIIYFTGYASTLIYLQAVKNKRRHNKSEANNKTQRNKS